MISSEAEAQAFCLERVDKSAFLKLKDFAQLLGSENARQNLVASASLDAVWRRHIADSLQLLDHVPRETGKWLDIGSGGGFPGLVVSVARPEQTFVLVEPRKLRAEWLRMVVDQLSVTNVHVVASRLETIPDDRAGVISARAFAPLAKLLRLSARFSTPTTHWVLPKGRSAGQELQEQSSAVRQMFHVEQSLTDSHAGIIIGQGVPQLR